MDMDHTAKALQDSYFPTRTAAAGSLVDYIGKGLLEVVKVMTDRLQERFEKETVKFNAPATSGRGQADVEGEIGWLPDPSQKGHVLIVLKIDQFDLKEAELFYHFDLPSGKKVQQSLSLGSGSWTYEPVAKIGNRLGDVMYDRLNAFIMSA